MGQVIFVGAGPGDPELITVKGYRALAEADRVIYAGSLVNPELLQICRKDTPFHDSAHLTLEEVMGLIEKGYKNSETIVRLHTGDPSVYGAIKEQIDELKVRGIPFRIIPGVSSVFAAAASIEKEFTLPGVSQTLILTRLAGRTPVPEAEDLAKLARHQTSMAIFLSVKDIDSVVDALKEGYALTTPVTVVYRASWPDEKIIEATLETIAAEVKRNSIHKQALILVGNFLGSPYERSQLYHPSFTHGYRQGERA